MAQITFTNTGGIQTSGDSYSAGNFELEEAKVLNLRNAGTYYTNLKYDTAGNEAVVLGMQNSATSFIVKSGDSNATATGLTSWQSLTPSMQVKGQSLYVNELIANGATPSYNFKVNGSACLSGNTYIGTSGAYMVYNSTTESIDFNFG